MDLKIERAEEPLSMPDVIALKNQKLFDFDTEKVVWVFSHSKKILIAENGEDWIISDWNKTLNLIDGIQFNLGQYLEEEGININ